MNGVLSHAGQRLLELTTNEASDRAEAWGITLKQFRVYVYLTVGYTQIQTAMRLGMWQPKVSDCLTRALRRNPHLPPLPYRTGRRRKHL